MTAETYVNQIVKKVKCSKKKRNEIRSQLLADIGIEMEGGQSFEKVMLRMGEPIAIAEEFNQNIPEAEKKKYKRGIVLKIIAGMTAVLAVLVSAAVWYLPFGKEFGSSGLFTKEIVEERSKEVIQLLDAEDYEAVWAVSDDYLQKVLTEEVIDSAKEMAGTDWGEFQSFGKIYLAEQTQQGKTRAVVQMNAAYENIVVTYTLFFDQDMKLSGFYIK